MPALPPNRSATAPRRGAVRHAPGRPDRGAATLELVVLFPVLLLLIFGVIQGALFFHGRNVALAAAEQGVRAGRADGHSDPGAVAVANARQFLTDTSELDNFTQLVITPAVDGDHVRVTVSARTVSLLPGFAGPQVRQTATGSLEVFTTGATR